MRKNGYLRRLCAAVLLPLLLCGCTPFSSVEDLYALPRLPEEYEALRELTSAVLSEGAEYAAPQAGTNLQPVQMVDLNGDGREEALAFFRSTSSEGHPLQIHIFRETEDAYERVAVIDSTGASVHSIRYADLNGNGTKEIMVSWKISAEIQALSVYTLEEDFHPVELMSASYARYEVVDLDGDKDRELVLLRSDEAEPGTTMADYYDWDQGSLTLKSSARLSMTLAELQWVQTGTLQTGETAVFITGRATGVEGTSRSITDILLYREPELTNIVLNNATGMSSEVFRFLNLQPTDINADGSTEVPMPAELPSVEDGESYWKIYWQSYSGSGVSERQAITYHNLMDSWYLMVPDRWDGHFTAKQCNMSNSEHATTFYSVSGYEADEELFTIYTLTGAKREEQAVSAGRQMIMEQANRTYAIGFADGYDEWRYAVPREELIEGFHRIVSQWTTAEN